MSYNEEHMHKHFAERKGISLNKKSSSGFNIMKGKNQTKIWKVVSRFYKKIIKTARWYINGVDVLHVIIYLLAI